MEVGAAVGGTVVGVSVGSTGVAEGGVVGVAGILVGVAVGGRVVGAELQPARRLTVRIHRSMKMICLIIKSSSGRSVPIITLVVLPQVVCY
jgi:hypothetical protein